MSITITVGNTQQLTATVYDSLNVLLTGRTVVWYSSAPSIATVSSTGLVTAIAAGQCTVTAVCEGRTGATAVTAMLPVLTATLDFAPLVRRSDLARANAFVTIDSLPQHTASGLLDVGGNARVPYPKTSTAWGNVAVTQNQAMESGFGPDTHNVTSVTQVSGPWSTTTAWQITPRSDIPEQYFAIHNMSWRALASTDNQDLTLYKRSVAIAIKAATLSDVGKTIVCWLADQAVISAYSGWGSTPQSQTIARRNVVLTTAWQYIHMEFPSYASQAACANPAIVTTVDPLVPTSVGHVVAPFLARAWQAEEDAADNWLNPVPFHETLGVLSADIYCNCWNEDSDDPSLYGSTPVKATTAIAAPDSARYYAGNFLKRFTLNPGDGIHCVNPIRIEDGGTTPPTLSNQPTRAAWGDWYLYPESGRTMPDDTELACYFDAIGTLVSVNDQVQRADNLASPGNADSGQPWIVRAGTWIVSGNLLRLLNNDTGAYMVIASGVSDATVEATLSTPTGADDAVYFRESDPNNLWKLFSEAGSAFLQKVVAGVPDTLTSAAVALGSTDRLGVILNGPSIIPTKNEVPIAGMAVSDPFNETAQNHGVGTNSTGTAFSRFEVSAGSGVVHTYGPIAMLRDQTRLGAQSGSDLIPANGAQFYRGRTNINAASEGYLDFNVRIVNVGARQLVFNATRAAVTTEGDRDNGVLMPWVPKRTITGRQFSDSAFETIPNIATILTTPTLLWIIREVIPWSFGDLDNLNGAGTNGYHPSLWQSGPYGSADYTFHADVNPHFDGTVTIDFTVARQVNGFMQWSIFLNNISTAQALVAWQRLVAFDIAVAALNGVPIAFGIGLGTGTGIQWLNDGDSFLDGTVSYQHTAGTAWAFDGGLGTPAGLGHMGVAADLDRVRQTNGWFQAIFAANSIGSNLPLLKAQVLDQITRVWGARKDHRLAV